MIKAHEDRYRPFLVGVDPEIGMEASDGIGRKTEAPWIRIFSPALSPTPRDGYYVVLHFSADGSAMFMTIGCGSTIWKNGDLKSVSDAELTERTSWARNVIIEKFGTVEPFSDTINLGAKAALPKTFEKATVLAKRIPVADIDEEHLINLVIMGVERLAEVYKAQRFGRDINAGDAAQIAVDAIIRPRAKRGNGQSFGLSAVERKAVELRAMTLAHAWLLSNDYSARDTSSNSPFDFVAEKDGQAIKVEVKGTTSDICESILMTRNEVDLHRVEKGRTALIVVSSIRLDRSTSPPTSNGGDLEAFVGWDIDSWSMESVAYQVRRPKRS